MGKNNHQDGNARKGVFSKVKHVSKRASSNIRSKLSNVGQLLNTKGTQARETAKVARSPYQAAKAILNARRYLEDLVKLETKHGNNEDSKQEMEIIGKASQGLQQYVAAPHTPLLF